MAFFPHLYISFLYGPILSSCLNYTFIIYICTEVVIKKNKGERKNGWKKKKKNEINGLLSWPRYLMNVEHCVSKRCISWVQ